MTGGGARGEVQPLAIGVIGPTPTVSGEARTTGVLSCSRRAEEFARLAAVEARRRGVEAAGVVSVVVDGA